MTLRFAAPWSTPLRVITVVVVGAFVLAVVVGAPFAALVLGVTVGLAAVYAVRGYAVEPGTLVVYRTGWETRIDLAGLRSAEVDPDAMRGSFRTFGMGGPFAFVGRYRSRAVGPYMAYATDRDLAVVLRWDHQTVVVTPDDPEAFAAAAEAAAEAADL